MKLQPVSMTSSPEYPKRSARWSRVVRQARRVGAVLSASAWLSLAGCYGSTALDDPESYGDAGVGDAAGDVEVPGDADVTGDAEVPARVLEWCEPDYRLSGDAATPEYTFACGVELPDDAPIYDWTFWSTGRACGEETAWARVERSRPDRIRVSFPNGTSRTDLVLLDPSGELVAELTPERPCVELEAEAGTWVLGVTQIDPAAEDVYFEVAVDSFSAE